MLSTKELELSKLYSNNSEKESTFELGVSIAIANMIDIINVKPGVMSNDIVNRCIYKINRSIYINKTTIRKTVDDMLTMRRNVISPPMSYLYSGGNIFNDLFYKQTTGINIDRGDVPKGLLCKVYNIATYLVADICSNKSVY